MGIIRTYTRHACTPETHCTPPWVRYTSRFAHTFELFVTAWCVAGYVVSGEVAVQSGCCTDVHTQGTIPHPSTLQTRNPSLMTSHYPSPNPYARTRSDWLFNPLRGYFFISKKRFGNCLKLVIPLPCRFDGRVGSQTSNFISDEQQSISYQPLERG